MMSSMMRLPPSAVVTSDASGTWGCGAFTKSGSWFQLKWPRSWVEVNIVPRVASSGAGLCCMGQELEGEDNSLQLR